MALKKKSLFSMIEYWRKFCKAATDCRHCRYLKACDPAYDQLKKDLEGDD